MRSFVLRILFAFCLFVGVSLLNTHTTYAVYCRTNNDCAAGQTCLPTNQCTTPAPTATPSPTPPPGCYYGNPPCASGFECNPVLVCTTPTPQAYSRVSVCAPYGDVNGDGTVSTADADLISKYVAGLTTLTTDQNLKADVDFNQVVNEVDALKVARFAQGLDNTFVACVTKASPCLSKGDVDGDGSITKKDVDLLTKHSLQLVSFTREQELNGDVDGSGVTDITDALHVARYLLNLSNTLPACTNNSGPTPTTGTYCRDTSTCPQGQTCINSACTGSANSTPTPTGGSNCPLHNQGDANCDSVIDLLDFNIWKTGFLGGREANGALPPGSSADFNNDSVIDLLDFNIWRNGFLSQSPQSPTETGTPSGHVVIPTPTLRLSQISITPAAGGCYYKPITCNAGRPYCDGTSCYPCDNGFRILVCPSVPQ